MEHLTSFGGRSGDTAGIRRQQEALLATHCGADSADWLPQSPSACHTSIQDKSSAGPTTQPSPLKVRAGIDTVLCLQRQESGFESCLPPDSVTPSPSLSQDAHCQAPGPPGSSAWKVTHHRFSKCRPRQSKVLLTYMDNAQEKPKLAMTCPIHQCESFHTRRHSRPNTVKHLSTSRQPSRDHSTIHYKSKGRGSQGCELTA